jgi:cell division initiation protein
MSITALEIQEVRFGEAKKGYDPNEVDEFLERVAADVDTLNRALTEAAARIKAAEARAKEAEQRAAEAASAPSAAPSAAVVAAAPASESSVSEDVIAKAFIAAQRSADALQEEARKEAEKVYREAESKGRDIVREALAEKQKTLAELDRLRESSESFRTEYLSLLKHFQADAQKRLSAFEDIMPSKSNIEDVREAQRRLTEANDAAVSAPANSSDSSAAGFGATASGSVQPPQPIAQLDDDDELDIEEID